MTKLNKFTNYSAVTKYTAEGISYKIAYIIVYIILKFQQKLVLKICHRIIDNIHKSTEI